MRRVVDVLADADMRQRRPEKDLMVVVAAVLAAAAVDLAGVVGDDGRFRIAVGKVPVMIRMAIDR